MSCGRRALVKTWDAPRDLRTVKASRYQANEASVKKHWKTVIKDLELSYKDERFWETQGKQVETLVGPIIFERLVKIFNLEMMHKSSYKPPSETSLVRPSEEFYIGRIASEEQQQFVNLSTSLSMSDFSHDGEAVEVEPEDEQSEVWTTSTMHPSLVEARSKISAHDKPSAHDKLAGDKKDHSRSGMIADVMSKTALSRTFNRSTNRSANKSIGSSYVESEAFTLDDVIVNASTGILLRLQKRGVLQQKQRKIRNPFFEMLYCSDSETDMIRWDSHYKQKKIEISASDEYSKKAELLTREIAADFFEWWVGLGSVEFKSEIKRPVDIEDLFQVWFDEHASNGLVLDPKILPCVLQSIANYVGAPKCACPKVLKRQIAWDIQAETSPQHTMAFGTSLPHKLKHIPPKNNTKETWHAVKIPEDLRTMSAVWGDISNLTSTKAFQKWLAQRPYMPMPPYLKKLGAESDKKQLFVVPSDFVLGNKSVESFAADLAIPISQVSLEIKEVLSRLLND